MASQGGCKTLFLDCSVSRGLFRSAPSGKGSRNAGKTGKLVFTGIHAQAVLVFTVELERNV